jgi:hypothetical protein
MHALMHLTCSCLPPTSIHQPSRVHATQGKRAALRSSTIMLRQPIQRLYGMQASDIDIYRNITREKTQTMVRESTEERACSGQGSTADDLNRTGGEGLRVGPLQPCGCLPPSGQKSEPWRAAWRRWLWVAGGG